MIDNLVTVISVFVLVFFYYLFNINKYITVSDPANSTITFRTVWAEILWDLLDWSMLVKKIEPWTDIISHVKNILLYKHLEVRKAEYIHFGFIDGDIMTENLYLCLISKLQTAIYFYIACKQSSLFVFLMTEKIKRIIFYDTWI